MAEIRKEKAIGSAVSKKNIKTHDTSWNNEAKWYDEMLDAGDGTYQKDLILPNVLRLAEIKKGDRVLDLACGQGFFSREFYNAGASVVGVDLSPNLISIAKDKSPKDINFFVSPAHSLPFAKDASVDFLACISAIQNIKNVNEVFTEANRVLSPKGKMIIVMNHPSFRIPKRSSWGFDEVSKVQYRRVDEYISESISDIQMHPGSDPESSTVSFHRPLQFYFKALQKAGFVVSRLEEWTSNKTSQPGPRANAENKSRKEFPLFLMIEATKSVR